MKWKLRKKCFLMKISASIKCLNKLLNTSTIRMNLREKMESSRSISKIKWRRINYYHSKIKNTRKLSNNFRIKSRVNLKNIKISKES
jgi:hypothetical protein